jgi:hypothetical protein
MILMVQLLKTSDESTRRDPKPQTRRRNSPWRGRMHTSRNDSGQSELRTTMNRHTSGVIHATIAIAVLALAWAPMACAKPIEKVVFGGELQGQLDAGAFLREAASGVVHSLPDMSGVLVDSIAPVCFTAKILHGKVMECVLADIAITRIDSSLPLVPTSERSSRLLALFVRLPYEGRGRWELESEVKDCYTGTTVRQGWIVIDKPLPAEHVLTFMALNGGWPNEAESETEWLYLMTFGTAWERLTNSQFLERQFAWKLRIGHPARLESPTRK